MTMAARRLGTHDERRQERDDGDPFASTGFVPEQTARSVAPSPERRLLLAVLEQAVHDLRIGRVVAVAPLRQRHRERSRLRLEAWFCGGDSSWLLSFENVCAVLALDPDAIRERLGIPNRAPEATTAPRPTSRVQRSA